jgi:putative transposase
LGCANFDKKIIITDMAYKKPEFINGEIYHIYNRGVEKRDIFKNDADRYRFVSSLFELNDRKMVKMRDRISERIKRNAKKIKNYTGATCADSRTGGTCADCEKEGIDDCLEIEREKIIELLVFCLMPNHYHLIIRQLDEGGITLFMKKLGNSYVGYFNEKHKRKGLGSLFQGQFKAVLVESNDQFLNLASYVFANPAGILDPEWKKKGVSDFGRTVDFLNSYRWSSYLDSIGFKNFPSVTQRDFLSMSFSEGSSSEENIKNNVEGMILRNFDSQQKLLEIDSLLLED